ncbi:hypothetical protein AAULR_14661, partial [Lacticaseibacillus rhamnosus MTCC 5462]
MSETTFFVSGDSLGGFFMQQHKRLVVILETAIIAAFAMALTY